MKTSLLTLTLVLFLLALTAQPAVASLDKDCSDFSTWRAAQRYFHKHGGPRHDPSRLDADHDGIACESLR
jgi:hypothetical protein